MRPNRLTISIHEERAKLASNLRKFWWSPRSLPINRFYFTNAEQGPAVAINAGQPTPYFMLFSEQPNITGYCCDVNSVCWIEYWTNQVDSPLKRENISWFLAETLSQWCINLGTRCHTYVTLEARLRHWEAWVSLRLASAVEAKHAFKSRILNLESVYQSESFNIPFNTLRLSIALCRGSFLDNEAQIMIAPLFCSWPLLSGAYTRNMWYRTPTESSE